MNGTEIRSLIQFALAVAALILALIFHKGVARWIEQCLIFLERHKWVLGFLVLAILFAVLFRYETFNTPRGIYILDRWTGKVEPGINR